MNVAVLVPVLGRPDRVRPLVDSIRLASAGHHVYTLFLVTPGDLAEHAAIIEARDAQPVEDTGVVDAAVVEWDAGGGDYARKINYGVGVTQGRFVEFDWLFLAADDLRFQAGWLDAAERCHAQTHACVVGTNDLGNPSVVHMEHSTHTLVSTRYLECGTADDPRLLLHEGYDHNFVDNEFVATAMARETYAQALDCVVEHMHPNWRKGAEDATYRKGQRAFDADRTLFRERSRLWSGG